METFYNRFIISEVIGREVLDSRGNPTVEAQVFLSGGAIGTAIVPSGASTGTYEAVELRDGDERYHGMGVRKACDNINRRINHILKGKDARQQKEIDRLMCDEDNTYNKANIGANAILAVSLANAKAASKEYGLELYEYIGGITGNTLPLPMMNILNGGAHSSNNIDIQEFMIIPVGAPSFCEGVRMCTEVYVELKNILKSKGLNIAVGDEGGFAPDLRDELQAIDYILMAISNAGYNKDENKKDFMISLDIAASEFKDVDKGCGNYILPKSKEHLNKSQMIEKWEKLVNQYPIFSLEDPLDEEDIEGWKELTDRIGNSVLLVGDDLFVTNEQMLQNGIDKGYANSILIKFNQIGSLTETINTVKLAKRNNYKTIISHRSGETEDTTIADLAVGLNSGYIKTGAPCRGERTAKYNRLIRIEEMINKEIE